MQRSSLFWQFLLAVCLCLPLSGCIETNDDDDTTIPDDDDSAPGDDDDDDSASGDDDTASGDDDTGDDDTAGDDDDTVASSSAPPGQALCAGGGRIAGKGISGVTCIGALEISSGGSASSPDGSLTWYAGPITRIAP